MFLLVFLLTASLLYLRLVRGTCSYEFADGSGEVIFCCNGNRSEVTLHQLSGLLVRIVDPARVKCLNTENKTVQYQLSARKIHFTTEVNWSISINESLSCVLELSFEDNNVVRFANATCQICESGYSDNGTDCINIDECSELSHDCNTTYAECRDTDGSFECVCSTGYVGNGSSCEDVDECSKGHDCGVQAFCNNTAGSYECTCRDGFTGNGLTCEDINECCKNLDICDAHADCNNTVGGYECSCRNGFTGNGKYCTENEEDPPTILGVSIITAIVFGILLILSLCWITLLVLLCMRFMQRRHNRQVHLGEYNNDKNFDANFDPVDFTSRASLNFSSQSVNTILFQMEQGKNSLKNLESSGQVTSSANNSTAWTLSDARLLGRHQDYINIVDGHLDMSPHSQCSSHVQTDSDSLFDITSLD